MLLDVLAHFCHRVADIGVGVEELVVLLRIPFGEWRQFLGDSLEESDNDSHRGGLHVGTELVDGSMVLLMVSMAMHYSRLGFELTGVR